MKLFGFMLAVASACIAMLPVSSRAQQTANDLLALCENFERTAKINELNVAVPNIEAARCGRET